MTYWQRRIPAERLLDRDVIELACRRISRIAEFSRTTAWIFWAEGRLIIEREEVASGRRLRPIPGLIGVYADEPDPTRLRGDFAAHLKDTVAPISGVA